MSFRRFPPPWTVKELYACFIVQDRAGQLLAYVREENMVPHPLFEAPILA